MRRHIGFTLCAVIAMALALAALGTIENVTAAIEPLQDEEVVGAAGMAIVKVNWDRFELVVSADGERSTVLEGKDGLCNIPPGCSELVYLTLITTDKKGSEWRMRSTYLGRELAVQGGEIKVLDLSPPFSAKVKAAKHRGKPGDRINFSFEIVDAKGLSFTVPQGERGQRQNPQILITDKDGRHIGKYDFQFG